MSTPIHTIPTVPDPWYRHRWPWFLLTPLFVVVIAGTITIWLAFARSDALVVDDYYKQGKAINQDLRRDRAAAELGVQLVLQYDPAGGQLQGSVAANDPLPDRVLHVKLVHPTRPELDHSLDVAVADKGSFAARLPFLEKGRWRVQVEGEQASWRLAGTWQWPQEKSLELRAR